MKYYRFKGILQEAGWVTPAYVGIDEDGVIRYLSSDIPQSPVPIESINGFALPGFQNAHSHAFQFAMAGAAEQHASGTTDDFWSWREAMYRCALSISPDQLESVAAMLYAEMLRQGYTHVAEFHYLHHDRNGRPYENLAELGERLLNAAHTAGIKITLVPVFYQQGNFGMAPREQQKRFISQTLDDYFQLLDHSATAVLKYPHASLGFGVHSLRAVNPDDVGATFTQGPTKIPFHLHAAEQLKEVDDCKVFLKKRPVEWILDNLPVDSRFHLVHCTHLDDHEVTALAKSGAHVVLCPGTEGNLGDGIFRLTDFAREGGSWSIGTDSHISLNPLEDLRWLDYAQRLTTHKRNTFDDGAQLLIRKVLMAGRKAMGNDDVNDFPAVGKSLDAVVFDGDSPLLSTQNIKHLLSALVYAAGSGSVLGTMVNGKWIVKNGIHHLWDIINPPYREAIRTLTS